MRPGDVIDGKYQIDAELGQGGMGRVLAASHLALGSTVAIKVLKAEALKYPEVPRRFMREARAASRLRSEHVVKVMDVGQLATGEPFMVMELLHGADLSTVLQRGAVPAALAVEYIAQACEGLAEAHAMGMVHRDVKPANLFVTKRPNGAPLVKVLDFGIATTATGDIDHKLTSSMTVIGSPSYMSPEQLRAAHDVDARSDIWSLGVTLYELLSGTQPFIGRTLTALTLKIVGEPHLPLQHVPPQLAAIVDRCLAKDLPDRYANVSQLADALAPLFPNGRVAAEMVAGSLSAPMASTLLGVASSAALGAQPTHPSGSEGYPAVGAGGVMSSEPWNPMVPERPARRGTTPPPTTTTELTAGESAPMRPAARGRVAWIAIGSALAGAIVTTGIALSQRSMSNASPAAVAAPPPQASAVAPAPPKPTVEPIAPEPAPPAEPMPELTPTPAKPPAKTRPAKPDLKAPRDPRAPPRDPRTPVEPPDNTKDPGKLVKEPPREPVIGPVKKPAPAVPVPVPVKEPKKPCAPNDPRCGL